jgi:dipeptidyl aminopeptidase/acylaminoacyl peptidase
MRLLEAADADTLRRGLLALETNTAARLSPDGRLVAFVRTTSDGQELWVRADGGRPGERRLAGHPGQLLGDLRWTADSGLVMYRHTLRGRESWTLAGVHADTGRPAEIPQPGPAAEYWLSRSEPAAVMYACRTRGSRYTSLLRANLVAPRDEPVTASPNPGFQRWLVDEELRPRGGVRFTPDGGAELMLSDDPDDGAAAARVVLAIGAGALAGFSVQRFSNDGERLFVITGDAPTRRLLAIGPGGAVSTLFAHPELDLESFPIAGEGVWYDPVTGIPDLCAVMDQRLRHHVLAPRRGTWSAAALERLAAAPGRSTVIVDRSADDQTWLIADVSDRAPVRYDRYYPATGLTDGPEPLVVNRPVLLGRRLPGLEDFCFTASDGLRISGFAMRPLGTSGPLPAIVLVHGGPAGRDIWRFHAEAQYLASLGYLSLHVNYRGSRGFGTRFRQAGNGEWGSRMQQDLYDAVAHGVATGLVDADRVAFLGSSYGGYAALLAACLRPDLARCAVAISPPTDLISFVVDPPAYWQPLAAALRGQILHRPDGGTVDRATLESRSPVHVLTRSAAPLLVAHGERDPRVPVADADAFVRRAGDLGVDVRFLRFPDEGHQVKSDRNREVLFGEIRQFLEVHLADRN